jgi:hypothetical protein
MDKGGRIKSKVNIGLFSTKEINRSNHALDASSMMRLDVNFSSHTR